ncbi:Protein kinase domain [Dillenia turbinata]|uniref:non-specific serine/threonine protein kinase n=1 Tax=Dillenia turbinata TaxID=194707 RepID=A0AAN8ZDR9_9MAGN
MKKHHPLLLPSFLNIILLSLLTHFTSSTEFIFNGFNHNDLLFCGNATIESKILRLTNGTSFTIGRALYPAKIPTKSPNSSLVLPFSTSFIFSMTPYKSFLPGHGIVFIFVPTKGINGTNPAGYFGLFTRTNDGDPNNHVFGVEFDIFENPEFNDTNNNHVGIDLNSPTSVASCKAGYWVDDTSDEEKSFKELKMNNGKNYQVWIDYADFQINVTMVLAGKPRPLKPLLSYAGNFSSVFEDEMYVGFTGSTGKLVESHRILAWSFSNSNSSISEALVTTGLPSFVLPADSVFKSKGFIAGLTVGIFCSVSVCVVISWILVQRKRRKLRGREDLEEWELEFWPHRITYSEIDRATRGFSEKNVIGIGGNGKVHKGVMEGVEVAVKRISHENDGGVREFLAEISSLGRLKHRNLVGLRGWCKREKGSLILVYDYMENGSLDKRVFECDDSNMLGYEDRVRVLKDVASGVLYLHEGWEARVLHRDIKASNVLLDKDMNGRLGDFGLSRMDRHEQLACTSQVVGTVGYLAPELLQTGRVSIQTDVFGFGVLILEVMCGRRPIEEGKPPLVDWTWELMSLGELVNALDPRLRAKGMFDIEDAERVLQLGLLCANPDPNGRPTMREVVKILEGQWKPCETESEDLDTSLLKKINSKAMWSGRQSWNHGLHPTFEDFRQSLSSSTLLSSSDNVLEGR